MIFDHLTPPQGPRGRGKKQVAQWTTIAHHGTSIMFGDTIIYDAQRQVTLDLKQWPEINSKT